MGIREFKTLSTGQAGIDFTLYSRLIFITSIINSPFEKAGLGGFFPRKPISLKNFTSRFQNNQAPIQMDKGMNLEFGDAQLQT